MFKNIESIIAIITAAISLLITIYKMVFKHNVGRSKAYYQDILIPFIDAYTKNNNIKPTRFLKNIAKRTNDNIPKYIFYLIDNKQDEKLKKVLIYDYFDIYHNDDNTMRKITKGIQKVLSYILFCFSFLALFFSSYCIALAIYTLFSNIYYIFSNNIEFKNVLSQQLKQFYFQVTMSFLFFGISLLCVKVSSIFSDDTYTLKEVKIKHLINKRVQTYDKKYDTFVL